MSQTSQTAAIDDTRIDNICVVNCDAGRGAQLSNMAKDDAISLGGAASASAAVGIGLAMSW